MVRGAGQRVTFGVSRAQRRTPYPQGRPASADGLGVTISTHAIELKSHYDGINDSSYVWSAAWAIPENESDEQWAIYVYRATDTDRLLEPLPAGGSYDAWVADGKVHVLASIRVGDAPADEVSRQFAGTEIVGEVQGLLFNDDPEWVDSVIEPPD
ncbi:hypothetical protein GCM10028814_02950 [Angustibacter aerolatus]